MRFRSQSHITDLLFTLSLFCVFVASALIVVIIGANVYRGTVNKMNQNYDIRASVTYLFTKVKQNDGAGAVTLGEIEGTAALCLETEIEGEAYRTWIYHHEGALKEIFIDAASPVSLQDGQRIVDVERITMAEEADGTLRFTSVDGAGRSVSMAVSPRC